MERGGKSRTIYINDFHGVVGSLRVYSWHQDAMDGDTA